MIPSLHRDGLKILPSITSPVIKAPLAQFDPEAPSFRHQPIHVEALPYQVPEVVLASQTPVEIGKPFVLKRGPERLAQEQYSQTSQSMETEFGAKRLALEAELEAYRETRLAELETQLQEAEAQIQDLYLQRDSLVTQAQAEGYQAGLEEGKQAILQEQHTLLETLTQEGDGYLKHVVTLLERVEQQHDAMLALQTGFVVELVRGVLYQLLGKAWLLFPAMVLQQCVAQVHAHIMQAYKEGQTLRVRLAPDVWHAIEQVTSPEVRQAMIDRMSIEVLDALPVASVQCQVLKLDGTLLHTYDARLEAQIDMLLHVVQEGFQKGLSNE
ncbi:MAG: hypothetical protein ACKO37_08085 [Vampirovibrionales bacterium]